ncbi:hypothetical protein M427DRAFT_56668 [Gonapodya prolifera JEL478]|uniref:NADH2 dehydrogenase n=1 Tax=Gonapodya prolifera (strain JEL478) TaxID=1344416 RepID=A0A139AGM0_GONPJ|nr:hypothetical protein M427DRAFT_56668 [Gonapodya prolifera JEL478]|eukprot:KXS15595.1 hypothetical protein M427DRAFT_56668 [Gonapodya prolifera JEL478]
MRWTRILLKETTGLTGLAVHPNPRPALISLYQKTLSELSDIPETALYRQSISAITSHRLRIVELTEDVSKIEHEIAAGQMEELIQQAQDELGLLEKVKGWKPWEALEVPEPEKQWQYTFSENKGSR